MALIRPTVRLPAIWLEAGDRERLLPSGYADVCFRRFEVRPTENTVDQIALFAKRIAQPDFLDCLAAQRDDLEGSARGYEEAYISSGNRKWRDNAQTLNQIANEIKVEKNDRPRRALFWKFLVRIWWWHLGQKPSVTQNQHHPERAGRTCDFVLFSSEKVLAEWERTPAAFVEFFKRSGIAGERKALDEMSRAQRAELIGVGDGPDLPLLFGFPYTRGAKFK